MNLDTLIKRSAARSWIITSDEYDYTIGVAEFRNADLAVLSEELHTFPEQHVMAAIGQSRIAVLAYSNSEESLCGVLEGLVRIACDGITQGQSTDDILNALGEALRGAWYICSCCGELMPRSETVFVDKGGHEVSVAA